MCGSRWATAAFIVSAELSTKGSCIWPEPNSSPTVRIPASSISLTMSRAACPAPRASSSSASRPLRSPSMMRRSRRRVDRPTGAVLDGGVRRRALALEGRDQELQSGS